MPDIVSDILNNQFMGVPTILIIAVLVFVIIFVWKKKPKTKEFKKLSLEQEVKKKYAELISTMGTEAIKKKLLYGFETKGYLGKSAIKNWKELTQGKDSSEMYIFELHNRKVGGWIRMQLGLKPQTYVIIPKEAITENYKEIVVNPAYHYDNVIGMIVFTKSASQVLENEAYKINHEQTLNEMVNWLGLQSYLSVQHTQSAEVLDHIANIEKQKKEDAISEMTGKNKKQ